jgi:trans-2,3-dihydro-3-hydroxyanthranilate isomerase
VVIGAASCARPARLDFRYRIVDVFTERPLAGNALCVVLDPAPEPVMQAIAREVNLSETTFPIVTGEDTYDVRIFTPGSEMPYAGHPTLGTAFVLGPRQWQQTSPGGTIAVEADLTGAVMQQPQPEIVEVDAGPCIEALGLPGAEGAYRATLLGLSHVFVPTDAPIDRLGPDPAVVAPVARAVGGSSLAPLRRVDDATLHMRLFAPGLGVTEDPGTGSAAGPAGVLAHQLWSMAPALVIRQGDEIGRPCRLEVEVVEGGVRVGGRVASCAEGVFTL